MDGMVGVVVLSGVVAALMQGIKWPLGKLPGADADFWKPLLAIVLGVVVTMLFEPGLELRETLAQGLVIGLGSSGLYSAGKSIVPKT